MERYTEYRVRKRGVWSSCDIDRQYKEVLDLIQIIIHRPWARDKRYWWN